MYKGAEFIEFATGLFIVILATVMVFKDLRRNKQEKSAVLTEAKETVN